jgi:hypothetical protein
MSTQTLVTDAELTQALGELEQSAGAVPSLDPPADEQGSGRKLRFRIGEKRTGEATDAPQVESAGSPAPSATAGQPAPVAPRLSLAKRVYRLADALIERANRPFAFLPPQVRNALGAAALTTIGMSLAALLVLPVLMPNRDALTFLEQLRTGSHTRYAARAGAAPAAMLDGAVADAAMDDVAESDDPDRAGDDVTAHLDDDPHAPAFPDDW